MKMYKYTNNKNFFFYIFFSNSYKRSFEEKSQTSSFVIWTNDLWWLFGRQNIKNVWLYCDYESFSHKMCCKIYCVVGYVWPSYWQIFERIENTFGDNWLIMTYKKNSPLGPKFRFWQDIHSVKVWWTYILYQMQMSPFLVILFLRHRWPSFLRDLLRKTVSKIENLSHIGSTTILG